MFRHNFAINSDQAKVHADLSLWDRFNDFLIQQTRGGLQSSGRIFDRYWKKKLLTHKYVVTMESGGA